MKVDELFEGVTSVKLDDLYIFQNNDDADREYIRKLADDINDGDEIEPVLVAPLTSTFRKQLKVWKEKMLKSDTHSKYANGVNDDIFDTPKKYVLLDGNHRYLAAKIAGLKKIPVEIHKVTPEDYVNYIWQEF